MEKNPLEIPRAGDGKLQWHPTIGGYLSSVEGEYEFAAYLSASLSGRTRIFIMWLLSIKIPFGVSSFQYSSIYLHFD